MAWVLAVVFFVIVQICLLVLVPHYCHTSDVPPMPWLALISLFGGAILAIIILMIGYVNVDSKRRGMNSLLWTLLVIFVPKALGFIAYFLLRKPLMMPCPELQHAGRVGFPVLSEMRIRGDAKVRALRMQHPAGLRGVPVLREAGDAVDMKFRPSVAGVGEM